MFHVSMRALFLRWGASFLSAGGGGGAYGGHQFWWEGGFEKNCKMGDAPHAPTMEKPEKNHLIIIALY